MAVYHQMGHDSQNLLPEGNLALYRGALLSPVNYSEEEVRDMVDRQGTAEFEMIFDPQLYYPTCERGRLPEWSYFPHDVETADLQSITWWQGVNRGLVSMLLRVRPHAVCSPAVVPLVYSDDYYDLAREIMSDLRQSLTGENIEVIQTLVIRLGDLTAASRPPEVSSIISRGEATRVFLVLTSDVDPRRELNGTEELKGAMRLIRYLERSGLRVLVGFTSSDLVLWKTAGAQDCATGKFFNVRRFTPSRFEPPPEGGGQVSYWFEEAMMAYVRESDLDRIRHVGLLSGASMTNPYGQQILNQLNTDPGTPWLRLSWRQYMYWFADFERRFEQRAVDPDALLSGAEQIWRNLDERHILMEEQRNDGSWLRPWRRAVLEAFND